MFQFVFIFEEFVVSIEYVDLSTQVSKMTNIIINNALSQIIWYDVSNGSLQVYS